MNQAEKFVKNVIIVFASKFQTDLWKTAISNANRLIADAEAIDSSSDKYKEGNNSLKLTADIEEKLRKAKIISKSRSLC